MFSFCFSRVGYSCFERLALTDFRDLSVGMKDTSWYSFANAEKETWIVRYCKDCIRDAFDFATRDPFNLAVTNENTDLWLWCFGYFWLSYVKGDLYIYIYLYMDTMLHDRSWVTQRRFRKHRTLDAMVINHFPQNPRIFTQKKRQTNSSCNHVDYVTPPERSHFSKPQNVHFSKNQTHTTKYLRLAPRWDCSQPALKCPDVLWHVKNHDEYIDRPRNLQSISNLTYIVR